MEKKLPRPTSRPSHFSEPDAYGCFLGSCLQSFVPGVVNSRFYWFGNHWNSYKSAPELFWKLRGMKLQCAFIDVEQRYDCGCSLPQPILPVCGPSRIYCSDRVCGDSISTADSEAGVGSLQKFETLEVHPPGRKLRYYLETENFGASKHCNDFLIGCGKRWVRFFWSIFCSK